MRTEYILTFPSKQNRNRFLSLIASNVGEYGYGLGMEFEGLEQSINSTTGHGRIARVIPGKQAYGAWSMEASQVTLDLTNLATMDSDFHRVTSRIESVASEFGAT